MKKWIFRGAMAALVGLAVWAAYWFVKRIPQRQEHIPTTRVRQGDLVIRAFTRGELRAVRSETLVAPNLFGTVQVTKLAPLGAFAREKDLIVEFDDSEVRSRLEEKQLELEQIEEQIKKAQAELAIRNNQDQVDLLQARYAVRRAELEVKRNELLSAIDARKNLLNLEEARRRLKQLEVDIKSRREQSEAELAVLREQRNRALVELNRERMRLSQTKLLASMSGLVAIRQNIFGGMRMFGAQVPDIREGDQVQPGMPVADVLDLSELEVVAKVGELDRANLREGQDVIIQLDALAGKKLQGKIKSLSGTASANVFSGDPAKKFDVTFSVDMKELLSAVGATPEQIRRVMETAERNRKKPVAQVQTASFGSAGGFPAMAVIGGAGGFGPPAGLGSGASQGGEQGEGAPEGRRRGGFGGGFFGQLSEEDRRKIREAIEKALGGRSMQDLSPEERQKIFAELRQKFQLPGPGQGQSGAPGPVAGLPSFGLRPPGAPGAAQGGREGGEGRMFGFGGPTGPFTEKELAEAKLPPPPDEDSQLEVLLRPGLLADVEIIVEKIPNAIHVPAQAVFEKEGKPVVYVKVGERFEPRFVKFSKRSESAIVVAEGLKPGEIIALADPFAKPGQKKEEKPAAGPNPMGGVGPGPRT
ncbi:MAG: HlyD family efflux transporter periplasmic adaptor subunit [Bryobacterales bacterium]|nr:HlyD family efflux transporter periplasmic adaptor subunit [Bryobacteraceae bacterium]MDW8355816.1 HlyD family efflux transporter periplasmic adaptor subunit [Bryobacterales bacterium]